jgi:UDP:flavonoid glycosyltransferase YjiC (YdhE family)
VTTLVLSPAYASHYGPLAVVAGRIARRGGRVVVATGAALRDRVVADGFEWRELVLGRGTNTGVIRPEEQEADEARHLRAFFAATREGPVPTLLLQAERREDDLLWRPEVVARRLDQLVAELRPQRIVSDHIALSATLALRALGVGWDTFVPGHPSQLPVADEVYGEPPYWPRSLTPSDADRARLRAACLRVTAHVTERFNAALREVSPSAAPVDDPFRTHGGRVLYAYDASLHPHERTRALPSRHLFLGPCVREEELPADLAARVRASPGRPLVHVSLGSFLSERGDVLATVAEGLRRLGARAAIATGLTPPARLGPVPDDWIVGTHLPQVGLLGHAAATVTHAGNNSAGEALRAGVPMLVLPLSTDQFAIAADLERQGRAVCHDPNALTAGQVQGALEDLVGVAPRPA